MALAGSGFEIAVWETSTLRPHEQTIPAHVEQIARELEKDGMQKDPMLIDGRTGTVLDGMHRLAAFAFLGVRRAVCCSLDYRSPEVAVRRWARVYRADGLDFREVLHAKGLTRRLAKAEAMEGLDERREGVAVIVGGEALVHAGRADLEAALRFVEDLDSAAVANGWRRRFVAEDEAAEKEGGLDEAVVLVQRLRKEDVLAAALGGKLFPCKTSMHRVDPRPVAVRYPLAELAGATTASLQQLLSTREKRLLPEDSYYEGRRYKERLLVLNPE